MRVSHALITNACSVAFECGAAFRCSLNIDARRWRADLARPNDPTQFARRFHRRAFATTGGNR